MKSERMNCREIFEEAFETRSVHRFLELLFPEEWSAIAARIIESGVEMSVSMVPWAPRWSMISPTVRIGRTMFETHVKSCLYRAHDCIHQLWGVPIHSAEFTDDEFYLYKRAIMCGEVAVLSISEFFLANHLWHMFPEVRSILDERNAMPMLHGPLKGKSMKQIACRLDGLLHKKLRPSWVRSHVPSIAFCDDYQPMLQSDREQADRNWIAMRAAAWVPAGAPNAPFSASLDGIELTLWMIDDFLHLMQMSDAVDEALRDFNIARRSKIILPNGWGTKECEQCKVNCYTS